MHRHVLRAVLLVAASHLLPAVAADEAAAPPIYRESFDADAGGWANIDPNGPQPTIQKAAAHDGGALQLSYEVRAKGGPMILGRMNPTQLTGARAVRFWIATSHQELMAFVVQEERGARYVGVFISYPGRWQHVEMSVDRLRLAADTKDTNDHVDLDQVQAVALIDLSGLLPLPGQQPGSRTLWVDDLAVDKSEAPTAYSAEHKLPYVLDDFKADYLAWLPLWGVAALDTQQHHLVWAYGATPGAGNVPVVFGLLGPLPAKGAGQVEITVTSAQPRQLAIGLQEENRDTRPERTFLSVIQVKGGGQKETFKLPIAGFQLEEKDKPKGEGPLQLELVDRISVIDVDVITAQAKGDNTLWVDQVRLTE